MAARVFRRRCRAIGYVTELNHLGHVQSLLFHVIHMSLRFHSSRLFRILAKTSLRLCSQRVARINRRYLGNHPGCCLQQLPAPTSPVAASHRLSRSHATADLAAVQDWLRPWLEVCPHAHPRTTAIRRCGRRSAFPIWARHRKFRRHGDCSGPRFVPVRKPFSDWREKSRDRRRSRLLGRACPTLLWPYSDFHDAWSTCRRPRFRGRFTISITFNQEGRSSASSQVGNCDYRTIQNCHSSTLRIMLWRTSVYQPGPAEE